MIGLVLFGAMLLAGCAPQLAVDTTAPPRSAAARVPAITNAIGVDNDPATFISVGRMNLDPGSRPAGPDALGRIHSMSKPITGTAAMILVDEGKLGLTS